MKTRSGNRSAVIARNGGWLLGLVTVMTVSCTGEILDRPAAERVEDEPDISWITASEWAVEAPTPELTSPETSPEVVPGSMPSAAVQDAGTPAPVVLADAKTTSTPSSTRRAARRSKATLPQEPQEQAAAPALALEAPSPGLEPAPQAPAPSYEDNPASEPVPPPPAPITSADFDGQFRFVGGQSQRAAVSDAIEASVEALPRAFHGIARRRLIRANPVDERINIDVVGDRVTVSWAQGFSVSCVLGGSAVATTGTEGQHLDVRLHARGERLVQSVKSKGGAGTVVFTLSEDRKQLNVYHEVSSSRLPVPVRYRLSYRRS